MQQWVPLAEAAYRLGVSIDTIRRRVKAKDLEARTNEKGQQEVLLELAEQAEADTAALLADAAQRIAALEAELIQARTEGLQAVARVETERDIAREQATGLRAQVDMLTEALARERTSRDRADVLLQQTIALVPRQLEDSRPRRRWWPWGQKA